MVNQRYPFLPVLPSSCKFFSVSLDNLCLFISVLLTFTYNYTYQVFLSAVILILHNSFNTKQKLKNLICLISNSMITCLQIFHFLTLFPFAITFPLFPAITIVLVQYFGGGKAPQGARNSATWRPAFYSLLRHRIPKQFWAAHLGFWCLGSVICKTGHSPHSNILRLKTLDMMKLSSTTEQTTK